MADYIEQKKAKPTIDELINELLDGEIKQSALSFLAFLTQNKMKPSWGAINSFNLSYKGKRVCIIKINKDCLDIRCNTQYNNDFNECFADADSDIKKLLLDSITYCFGCGTCKPGLDVTILGKELKSACFNPVIRFENPDASQLECAKKLVMLRRKAIADGTAPSVTYIAKSKR